MSARSHPGEPEPAAGPAPEFDGRVALVTGGSGGIGLAAAGLLLRRGARVMISGTPTDLPAALDSLAGLGDRVAGRPADVCDETAMAGLVGATVDAFGSQDQLVCAAGIQRYGAAADTPTAEWDTVLDVNLRGAFLAVRESLPHLRAGRSPAIVLVSSVQAFVTQTQVAAYTASKGGLNALTRSIAVDEAPHGVRVNAVCPGSVDTPMLRKAAADFSDGTDRGVQELVDAWGRNHPLGRVARPEEVAEAVCFLGSPRASFITGVALPVDGGLLAQIAVVLPQ
jgi:NAD(P)-dependent dehydrogenase (short-subunit alcohol dehydrogenase family)